MDELLEYHKDRIQKILKLYKMNIFEIAKLTKINNNTIKSYNNLQRIPETLTILSITTTFGISVDWLYGITNKPYTEESIRLAENQCYMKFRVTIPYKQNTQYSLEARANLIVLRQYEQILKETIRKTTRLKKIQKEIEEIAETGNPKYKLEQ